jgi:hypothetical protein
MKKTTKKTRWDITMVKPLKEVPKDPCQRNIPALFPRRKALRKSLAPTYYPITHHVYYDGSSFRVRVRIDGETVSVSTKSKKKALKYRDRLLDRKKA